jgi:hypothetical protein
MYNFEQEVKLQQPNHIVSLATSAVLVSVDVNVWSATKQDRVISSEVTTSKKADPNAGRFVKNLLSNNPYHKDLVNYRQTIYNWLKRSTYRWNNAQDLLPTISLETFKSEYDKHEREFNRLLDVFCDKYDSIKSNMAFSQGDMYNREDYPEVSEVRRKFGCRLYISEVPEQDFRCQVASDLASDLKITYERQAREIVKNVLHQQTERIIDVMESIAHCCGTQEITTKDGETATKKRKIYDTTIEKAKDLCRTIGAFRYVDNEHSQKLRSVAKQLDDALEGVSTDMLRDSDYTRDRVKNEIDDILSKFSI